MRKVLLVALLGAQVLFVSLAQAITYTVVDLQSTESFSSAATAINANGDVVVQDTSGGLCANGPKAYVWTDGVATLIPSPTFCDRVSVPAINDAGQVAYTAQTPGGAFYPFDAYLWDRTQGTEKLFNGTGDTSAYAINNLGQILGFFREFSSPGAPSDYYLWSKDAGMRFFKSFIGVTGWGSDLNNLGQILLGTSTSQAYIWSPEALTTLDLSGVSGSKYVYKFNDAGMVLGYLFEEGTSNRSNYIWTRDGGARAIGNAASVTTYLNDLNLHGRAVGYYSIATTEAPFFDVNAVLWSEADGFQDLTDLMAPDSPFQSLDYAYGINDSGQIVGQGTTLDGKMHAFLASPVYNRLLTATVTTIDVVSGAATVTLRLTGPDNVPVTGGGVAQPPVLAVAGNLFYRKIPMTSQGDDWVATLSEEGLTPGPFIVTVLSGDEDEYGISSAPIAPVNIPFLSSLLGQSQVQAQGQ